MVMPSSIKDREQKKFVEVAGETAVRTKVANTTEDSVPVSSGLLSGISWESFTVEYATSTKEIYRFYSEVANTN